VNVDVFDSKSGMRAPDVAKQAIAQAERQGQDVVLVDTAGRLHVDLELMEELREVKEAANPTYSLLVVDAMTGQDAVNVAESFLQEVDLTGIILTKLDGDARGGAALSMSYVTERPIKFAGVGEKLTDLEQFHPDRMASRILGMGDVMTLIEKAEAAFDETEARAMEEKLRKAEFTFEDFLSQMQAVKKMGPISQVLGMLPGMSKLPIGDADIDNQLPRIEAMIRSMTPRERNDPHLINGSRRKRIAAGSGTTIQEINKLVKQFDQVRKMVKQMSGGKGKPKLPGGMKLPPGMGF
jgi:signal recognition particle subunit SRP54